MMKKLFVTAAFFLAFAGYSSEPLLLAGIIANIHISNNVKSSALFKTATPSMPAGDLPYDSGACQTGKTQL